MNVTGNVNFNARRRSKSTPIPGTYHRKPFTRRPCVEPASATWAQLSDHLVQHRRPRGVLSDRDSPETFLAKHVVVMVAAKAPSDRKIADTPLLRLVPVVSAADLQRDRGVECTLLLGLVFVMRTADLPVDREIIDTLLPRLVLVVNAAEL